MTDIKDLIVWGGLYRVNHTRWNYTNSLRNDQIYHQAVPALDKDGNVWMQDTHQLRYPGNKDGSKTLGAMDRIFKLNDPKSGDWAIRQSNDWYHKGNEKITSESMLKDYELICDLHDYRPFKSGEDYRDYDSSDVLHGIHLYDEHGYSWDYGDIGINLIRKDAKSLLLNKFKAALSDVNSDLKYPSDYSYSYNKLIELYESIESNNVINLDERTKTRYQTTLWVKNRLKEMREEIDQYVKDHKYKPHYDFEDEAYPLEKVHKDIKRYLSNDCYCSNEIYHCLTNWYKLYYPETKCQVLIYSSKAFVVLARSSDEAKPDVLIFQSKKQEDGNYRITGANFIEATKNNIEIMIEVAKGLVAGAEKISDILELKGRKFDDFKLDDTDESLNAMINQFLKELDYEN